MNTSKEIKSRPTKLEPQSSTSDLAHCINLNNRCIFCLDTLNPLQDTENRNDIGDFAGIWLYIQPNCNDNLIPVLGYTFLNGRNNDASKIPPMCSPCQDHVLKVKENLWKISCLKLELERLEDVTKRLGLELRNKAKDSPETPSELGIYASRYKTLMEELGKEKASSKSKVMSNTIAFLNQLRGCAVDTCEYNDKDIDANDDDDSDSSMEGNEEGFKTETKLEEDERHQETEEIDYFLDPDSFDRLNEEGGNRGNSGGGEDLLRDAIEMSEIGDLCSDPVSLTKTYKHAQDGLQKCMKPSCQNVARLPPEEMEPHLREQHQVEEVIRCKFCPFIFPSKEDLIEHVVIHRKREGGIPCDICPGVILLFTESSIKKHYYLEHGIGRKLVCEWEACNYSCFTQPGLNKHLSSVHKVNLTGEKSHFQWQCSSCDKSFSQQSVLRRHEKSHLKEKTSFQCSSCGKSFRLEQSLRLHFKYVHLGEKGALICDVCGGHYKGIHELEIHQRMHTGERPHVCHICGKGFRRIETLRKHLRSKFVHKDMDVEKVAEFKLETVKPPENNLKEEVRPHKCDVCGKGFRYYGILKKHKLVHEDQEGKSSVKSLTKPRVKNHREWRQRQREKTKLPEMKTTHKCSLCEKSFKQLYALKRHVKYNHEGKEGEHVCETCGKRFRRSYDLHIHKNFHTGERPYQCHICGGKFRYRSGLTTHLNTSKLPNHKNEGKRKKETKKRKRRSNLKEVTSADSK